MEGLLFWTCTLCVIQYFPVLSNGLVTISPILREAYVNNKVESLFRQSVITPEFWEEGWKQVDTNGDGRISVQELKVNNDYALLLGPNGGQAMFNYYDALPPGPPDGILYTSDYIYSFRLLDKNGDGVVTEDEFRERINIILDAEQQEALLLDERALLQNELILK